MTNKREPYQTFSKEFKQEAVRRLETSGQPAAEVARELFIRRNQLYKWKEQLEAKGEQAFAGRGRPTKDAQSELATLRQELKRLKEENEILKRPQCSLRKN